MSERWRDIAFATHEPPPGGLAMLRARLMRLGDMDENRSNRGTRSRALRWAVGLGALATAAAVLVLLLRATPAPDAGRTVDIAAVHGLVEAAGTVHPALIRYGLAPSPDEPVVIAPTQRGRLAAMPVPVARPDVVFYWVSAIPPGE